MICAPAAPAAARGLAPKERRRWWRHMAPSLQACLRTLNELLDLLSGNMMDALRGDNLVALVQQAVSLSNRCYAFKNECLALPNGGAVDDAARLSLERCGWGSASARTVCMVHAALLP